MLVLYVRNSAVSTALQIPNFIEILWFHKYNERTDKLGLLIMRSLCTPNTIHMIQLLRTNVRLLHDNPRQCPFPMWRTCNCHLVAASGTRSHNITSVTTYRHAVARAETSNCKRHVIVVCMYVPSTNNVTTTQRSAHAVGFTNYQVLCIVYFHGQCIIYINKITKIIKN